MTEHPELQRRRRYAEEERQRNTADDPARATETGEAASENESDADLHRPTNNLEQNPREGSYSDIHD